MDDFDLLRAYCERQAEDAFAALVRRYINLVYAAALRQMREPHAAEEVTQVVFTLLARKAASLRRGTILPGWLLRATRYVAANARRSEQRRQNQQRESMLHFTPAETEATWKEIAPLLDESLAKLGEKDRNAVTLRFFEERSFKEIGTLLGLSENNARVRVARAVERLRTFLVRRGVVVPVATLAGVLAANSVQAAPVHLAATVSATALSQAAVGVASLPVLAQTTLQAWRWMQLKLLAWPAAVLVLVGGVVSWGSAPSKPPPAPRIAAAPVVSAPVCEWQRSFGGRGRDQLSCLQQTPDGGFILGGTSGMGGIRAFDNAGNPLERLAPGGASGSGGTKTSPNYGGSDYWVIRLDPAGQTLWERSYGGTGHDELFCLDLTADGGFILGGVSRSPPSGTKTSTNFGGTDCWVVRLDAAGNQLWDRSFGGKTDERLYAVRQTFDGRFILGGSSLSGASGTKAQPAFGNWDFWVVLVDAEGHQVWDRTHGCSAYDSLHALLLVPDGGFLVGGVFDWGEGGDRGSPHYGQSDFGLFRLDANGRKLWDAAFGGTGYDGIYTLQPTLAGGFVLGGDCSSKPGGAKTSPAYGARDFWVVCVDADGQKLWDRSYGGTNDDFLWSLESLPNGGHVAGGRSASGVSGTKTTPGFGGSDYWLVRFDDFGHQVWDQDFGGTGADVMRVVRACRDGGLILGGYADSGISGNKTEPNYGSDDFWVIKLPNCEPLEPPAILAHPQGRNLAPAEPLVLTIQAHGNPLLYQWCKDGAALPGAIQPRFVLPSARASDSGLYACIVSNQVGWVTSDLAGVRVGSGDPEPGRAEVPAPGPVPQRAAGTAVPAASAPNPPPEPSGP